MRRLLQPLWVLLALLFLAEAWLWEHLEPVVARIVAWLPLHALKAWLTERVERLSPAMTLGVFLVPVVLLFPLKLLAVWMMAHHNWLGAFLVLAAGKLVGVGVAAFIFDVTRPKLLQMAWFVRVYGAVIRARGWAYAIAAPFMEQMRRIAALMRARSSPRYLRMIWRLRRRLHAGL